MGLVAGLGSLALGAYGMAQGSPASQVQYPGAFSFPGGGAASQGALSGIGIVNQALRYAGSLSQIGLIEIELPQIANA